MKMMIMMIMLTIVFLRIKMNTSAHYAFEFDDGDANDGGGNNGGGYDDCGGDDKDVERGDVSST